MSLTKLLSDAAATKALVGRQIVRVETRAFREDGQTYTNPVLILDNGARISFQGHTPDSGDAVTLLLVAPEKRKKAEKPAKVASEGPLVAFRTYMKALDETASVIRYRGGFKVRATRFWEDGEDSLYAFRGGCPAIKDVRHIGIDHGRHVWHVIL